MIVGRAARERIEDGEQVTRWIISKIGDFSGIVKCIAKDKHPAAHEMSAAESVQCSRSASIFQFLIHAGAATQLRLQASPRPIGVHRSSMLYKLYMRGVWRVHANKRKTLQTALISADVRLCR